MYRRIRDLREDCDLTQREMGLILHCSQRVYSNYERGDLDIPTDILIKLAYFHNVSIDYLLELTNCKEPYMRVEQKSVYDSLSNHTPTHGRKHTRSKP